MASPPPSAPVRHKAVFEIRYDYGYTYLDRCGYALNNLTRANAGWMVDSVDPGAGTLKKAEMGGAFTFGASKLALSFQQTQTVSELPDAETLADLSCGFGLTTMDALAIEDVTRVGFRLWTLYGVPSHEDAVETVLGLGVLSRQKLGDLGLESPELASFTVVVDQGDRLARVAVTPAEQQISIDRATLEASEIDPSRLPRDQRKARISKLKAKKAIASYPHYSILVDIDSFLEYPEDIDKPMLEEFIVHSHNASIEIGKNLFSV